MHAAYEPLVAALAEFIHQNDQSFVEGTITIALLDHWSRVREKNTMQRVDAAGVVGRSSEGAFQHFDAIPFIPHPSVGNVASEHLSGLGWAVVRVVDFGIAHLGQCIDSLTILICLCISDLVDLLDILLLLIPVSFLFIITLFSLSLRFLIGSLITPRWHVVRVTIQHPFLVFGWTLALFLWFGLLLFILPRLRRKKANGMW